MTDKRHRTGGFTLVEILIVAVVVGVLAAIALPNLQDAVYRSDAARAVADMRTVRMAVFEYREDAKTLPKSAGWGTTPPELAPYLDAMPFTYKDLEYRLVVNAKKGRVEFRVRYDSNHPIGLALRRYRNPGSESGSVTWTKKQTRFRMLENNQ